MSSRAGTDMARLRRLRRIGHRHGLTILTTIKPGPEGGYMLSVEETRQIVLGDRPKPYSAGLDAIEAHIDALDAAED